MMRELLYKFAWDTRCRNVDVARILSSIAAHDAKILDAGCGEYGLSAFMPRADITGVDILPTDSVDPRLNYVHGSILELPFENGSFDIAVSVDVLEHLPEDLRPEAVRQLVKAAKSAVVITFPDGESARKIDEHFEMELTQRQMPIPDWLEEHLTHRYPQSGDIIAKIESAADESGRRIKIRVVPSEHLSVSKLLRWAAARSKYIYIAANLGSGAFLPLMPRLSTVNAYRAIVVAEFEPV